MLLNVELPALPRSVWVLSIGTAGGNQRLPSYIAWHEFGECHRHSMARS